jgi:hypothetical protein
MTYRWEKDIYVDVTHTIVSQYNYKKKESVRCPKTLVGRNGLCQTSCSIGQHNLTVKRK